MTMIKIYEFIKHKVVQVNKDKVDRYSRTVFLILMSPQEMFDRRPGSLKCLSNETIHFYLAGEISIEAVPGVVPSCAVGLGENFFREHWIAVYDSWQPMMKTIAERRMTQLAGLKFDPAATKPKRVLDLTR